jgi:hypothetical protein
VGMLRSEMVLKVVPIIWKKRKFVILGVIIENDLNI